MGLAIGTIIERLEENLRRALGEETQPLKKHGAAHALLDMSINIEHILYGKRPPHRLGSYRNFSPEKLTPWAFEKSLKEASEALCKGLYELQTINVNVAAERMGNAMAYLEDISMMEPRLFQPPQLNTSREAARNTLKTVMKEIVQHLRQDNIEFEATQTGDIQLSRTRI